VSLPAAVVAAVAGRLGTDVVATVPVGGGCISAAARVDLADGSRVFVKAAPAGAAADLFAEEARSLGRLRDAAALRVPQVLAVDAAWLALEWLEPAPGTGSGGGAAPASAAELGRGLARLHAVAGPDWGWDADNYIGPLRQWNGAAASWPAFWWERRLLPQLQHAEPVLGAQVSVEFGRLLGELDERLAGAAGERPALLHGDLWSGNVHFSAHGPALIDPASYYGHREVDLAMAALFGGFGADFERSYAAEWPLPPGADMRRAIYQLYYLLVHVNLFGAGYVEATRRTLRLALA
jgi:fructosamine-3-kinase